MATLAPNVFLLWSPMASVAESVGKYCFACAAAPFARIAQTLFCQGCMLFRMGALRSLALRWSFRTRHTSSQVVLELRLPYVLRAFFVFFCLLGCIHTTSLSLNI